MFGESEWHTHNVAFVCSYECEKVTELINFNFFVMNHTCSVMRKYGHIFMHISEKANKMRKY
jgi:hypothetical protein